jgi:hypothetical protein
VKCEDSSPDACRYLGIRNSPGKTYYFTVNNVLNSALAWNVVVWMVLNELREMVMNTAFFSYLSTIMLKYAFKMLEKTISKAK